MKTERINRDEKEGVLVEKMLMRLTAQERQILQDIYFARIKVLYAGNSAYEATPSALRERTEQTARQALHVFDFFRSATAGNTEAVRIQLRNQQDMKSYAGIDDYDGIISDYNAIIGRIDEIRQRQDSGVLS